MEKYIKEIVNHSDQRTDFTLLAYVIKSERNHNKEMVKLKLKNVIIKYANEHTLKQCFRLAIAVLDLIRHCNALVGSSQIKVKLYNFTRIMIRS